MSRKISEDFKLHRYGVDVRLANESDSEFILSLRTDKKLSRFIHATNADIEKQRQWMKDYKKREERGEDYYFIYYKDGEPFGLNRIYDIKEHSATGGSWLCKPGTDVEYSIATVLIERDIIFDILNLETDCFDVRLQNKKVQKLHLMLGAEKIGETELDVLFLLSREAYRQNKDKLMKLLGIEE